MRSEERPSICLFGATDQAAFDAGGMQRDASTCRARSRAAICNAARYINIGCAFLNERMMLQYSRTNNQVYTHESEGTVISFDETIERALDVYRLSFCLRSSVKSITLVNSSSYSCQQNALINKLVKPLSNCRSRNSGRKLLTFQAFRVSCGVCLFRRNVFQ